MISPLTDISLAQYTYYRIGGVAREAYFPHTTQELTDVVMSLHGQETEFFILGGGTNVLVGDGYWDGAVIIMTQMDGFRVYDEFIECNAGISSTRVAEIALEHGKTGLEFLYLLPGTVGGALAGNARYDMTNISDVVVSLVAIHPEKKVQTFDAGDISFTYKTTSITKEGWVICELSLGWSDGNPKDIIARMDSIERSRLESHHFDFPSSGCIFKNDYEHNIQVGKLIDSLGLKRLSVGGAEVAWFHANFIINTGNATARDVLTLIETIEQKVREKTGIQLEREVRLLGNFV
jgi:UDP-N-acetylmuramate dehydrogenase